MDGKKVLEVIDVYRKYFEQSNVPKESFPHDESLDVSQELDGVYNALAHCHGMLDEMEKFVHEGRMEKVFRWLGFVQGCLWSTGRYTLEQMKNHNKPPDSINDQIQERVEHIRKRRNSRKGKMAKAIVKGKIKK